MLIFELVPGPIISPYSKQKPIQGKLRLVLEFDKGLTKHVEQDLKGGGRFIVE